MYNTYLDRLTPTDHQGEKELFTLRMESLLVKREEDEEEAEKKQRGGERSRKRTKRPRGHINLPRKLGNPSRARRRSECLHRIALSVLHSCKTFGTSRKCINPSNVFMRRLLYNRQFSHTANDHQSEGHQSLEVKCVHSTSITSSMFHVWRRDMC
jgi:hypothetical protein